MHTRRRIGRAESSAIGTAIAISALMVLGDQWNEARLTQMRGLVERRAEKLGRLEGEAAIANDVISDEVVPRVRDVRDASLVFARTEPGAHGDSTLAARASAFGVALRPALETVRLAATDVTPLAETKAEVPEPSLHRAITLERERLAADELASRTLARRGRLMRGVGLGIGMTLLLFACGKLRREVERGARHEEELRERERRAARALDTLDDALIVLDPEARVLQLNHAAADFCTGDAIGQPFATAFAFAGDGASSLIARALAGDRGATRTALTEADGGRLPLALHAAPLRDEDGVVLGAVVVGRDASHSRGADAILAQKVDELARAHEQQARALRERDDAQRALERSDERLRQAQKYETLGNVAGSVAHDFNNLLSVILSYGELLQRSLPTDSPRYVEAEQITRAGRRAAELTGQLLAFSRQELPAVAAVDLAASLAGMRHMLVHLLGEDIGLQIEAVRELSPVRINAGQLEQVLLNLSLNARDAMPLGGMLTIAARDVVVGPERDPDHPGVEPGGYVHLSVDDTGTGMDASVQARIFEPFFTTKQRGKGTGLGLSTVFGIIKQCGGVLRVESTLGRGSTFHAYFPHARASDASALVARALASSQIANGTETVLLVEDDDQVRVLAQAVLERRGYRVLAANGGEEALRVERGWNGPIHVLVTDVVMPRMSGRQLAEQLSQWRPRLKVLFMSGYADDKVMMHGVLQAGVHLLHKPLTPDGLAHKLREVLDRV